MKVISLSFLLAVTLGAVYAQPAGRTTRTSVTLDQVLDEYAKLTQRTILRPATLPALDGPIPKEVSVDTNGTIRAIEAKLRERGMEVLPDGGRFTRVVPTGWSNSPAAAFLATIKSGQRAGELLPAGVADWSGSGGADLLQALEVYGMLRGRTLLRSTELRSPPIKLTTTTPLTTDELCYALKVVLALNGIAALDDGEKLVQLVPIEQWKSVQIRAPKAQPGAALLDPKELPKLGPEAPGTTVKRLTELYRQYLHGEPPWTPRPADRLVEFYAGLNDLNARPSKACGRWSVVFEITTPMTKAEVCYAVETVLRLHNIAIIEEGESRLTAIPAAELRSRKSREASAAERLPKP